MKISKYFLWLAPYVNSSIPHIKNLYRLKRISARSPRKDQIQRCNAITTIDENKNYKITIYRFFQNIDISNGIEIALEPYSKIDILESLAHELAHLEHWNHTPEHKKLENKLLNLFMGKLKRSGYVSEEESES